MSLPAFSADTGCAAPCIQSPHTRVSLVDFGVTNLTPVIKQAEWAWPVVIDDSCPLLRRLVYEGSTPPQRVYACAAHDVHEVTPLWRPARGRMPPCSHSHVDPGRQRLPKNGLRLIFSFGSPWSLTSTTSLIPTDWFSCRYVQAIPQFLVYEGPESILYWAADPDRSLLGSLLPVTHRHLHQDTRQCLVVNEAVQEPRLSGPHHGRPQQ